MLPALVTKQQAVEFPQVLTSYALLIEMQSVGQLQTVLL